MKILLQCVILLMVSFGTAQEKNEWKLVKDIEKGYRINFPSDVKSTVQDVTTAKGTVKMHTDVFQQKDLTFDQNLIYMTAFTIYPSSFFEDGLASDESKHIVLNNAVDGAVKNTNGILISSDNIMFNGYLGRHSKIKIKDLYIIEMQTILVEFKLYLAQVIYEEKDEGNINSTRFFNSFELIKVNEK